MVFIDAMSRQLPGVLGNPDSSCSETYVEGLFDYPHYTRPETISDMGVPSELLSGDPLKVSEFRRRASLIKTYEQRPNYFRSRVWVIEILSYSKSILIRLLINWLNWDAVMRRNKIIEEIEKAQEKEIPEFNPGDTVSVSVRVKEGERERLQAFDGVVIGKRNKGINSSFIVRKISHGVGVERTFQTHSPLIASIEVKRRGT